MNRFYDSFLGDLRNRYPVKAELVNELTDLLRLEKENIYRRLRGEVAFTAAEVMRVAAEWNISLDNITATNRTKTRPFRLKTVEFLDPSNEDYSILEQHNRDLAAVADDPDGVAIEVVNTLPRGLYCRSEPLTRFVTLKWRFKHFPSMSHSFSDIQIPERMRRLDLDYIRISHRIPEMHSIHDPHMIERMVEEIVYYRSIGMITQQETLLLRDELSTLVDYLERVTRTGLFPDDGGGRMFFYLSHTWIDTEYFLYRAQALKLSLVKAMERYYLSSIDESVSNDFMKTARAAKRMSVLMSESNALQQKDFFGRQRKKIASL